MNEIESYKVPPQSLETEDSILCSCLLNKQYLEQAVSLVSPEDFYRTAHQKIFNAIMGLYGSKEPVDLNTLTVRLREQSALEDIGGGTYLAKLLDIPMATNMEYSCGIIKQCSTARRMIEAGGDIAKSGFDITSENLSETLDRVHALVTELVSDSSTGQYVDMNQLVNESIDRYESMNERTYKAGIKTGFDEIDLLTGGFRNSRLVIIAARPRMGKTALMLNMATNMAGSGHRVGIFSLEMDKEELADRMMASETGINSMRLSMGTGPNGDEWLRINEASARIIEYKIVIDDTGGLPVKELKKRIRNMKKEGIEIVFIDQLSKIRGDRRKSRFEQATEIVEELSWLKKELRMPVVLLAQINRRAEDRTDRKPTLSDLKNTGQLEEDADIILIGHRPYEYDKKPGTETIAYWELAKHRGGPCRDIRMEWYAKVTKFTNHTDPR